MKLRLKGAELSHKLREIILDCTFSPYYVPSQIFLLLVLLKQLNLIKTWIVLFIGLFDLNQKWKLKLYFFATTFCLTEQLHSLTDYLALITALLISLQIYNQLSLPGTWDNIAYFSGFTTFFLIRVFKYVAQTYYSFSLSGRQILCVIPAFLLMSYVVIKMRVQTIKYQEIKNLKSPTLSIKYVEMLKQQLKQSENIHSYMFMHIKTCYLPSCFCHESANLDMLNPEISEQVRLREKIINSVFLEILATHNWNAHDRTQIIHKYTQFLIESKQLAQAIQIHYQLQNQSMNFFNVCLNYRVGKKLKLSIKQKNYFDNYRSKLQHIINYDLQVSYVTKQIRGILFQKIILWKELCKQNPQLKSLESQGKGLVKRIQKLHDYFTFVVRPTQEILSVCKATLAYASYLVLTTNYTQFANSLVKKTKKLFEESKGDVGVRLQFGLFLKLAINHEKMMQNTFQLIIVNISADLCKLFHQEKSEIIFKNITTLIPQQFAPLHSKGLDNFVHNSNLQRQNSTFFGQSIELPFYLGLRQIMYMFINPSLYIDILENCILVKCIVKKSNNEMKNFIVDLQGKIYYKEQQTFKQLVSHQNTKSILSKLKNQWQTERTIRRLEQTLVQNDQSLTKIFQPLFPHQLQKVGFSPLIRISIKNQSLKKQTPKTEIFMISNKLKNIQGVMESKQNDSQSSNSSRKDSIQNVLMLLMQSSSLKTEVFLTITLLMLLICVIVSFQIFNNFFIVWGTGIKEKNPVYTQINFINLKVLMNKAISWSYDVSKYENIKNQTEGLFNQLYLNNMKGIPLSQIGRKELYKIFKQQVLLNNNNILGENNDVSLFLEQQMKRTIPISHSSMNNVTLDMSLSSILSNLFVEVFLLSDGKPIDDTLLSFAYLPQFYGQYEKVQQNINIMLEEQMKATSRNLIIVVCFVTFLFLLFLIPIFKFNFANKKKQEKIYSLLASLQTRLILQEIKKLQKVEGEISIIALEMNEDRGIQSGLDFPSSQQFDGNKNSDKKEQNNFQILFQGISKIAADEMLNNFKDASRIKIRKRVGQIIVEGSNCDRKKLRKSDWLILMFLALFIGMTHLVVWHKMSFMNYIDDHFKNSVKKINYFKSSQLSILNSKMYSDSYNSANRLKFGGIDLGDWIGNWVVQNQQQDVFQTDQQIAIEQCSLDILLCINNFSQLILEEIIKKEVFQSYQETRKIVEGTKNATALTQKLRFKLFFAQQLQDYIQKRKMEQLTLTFTDMEKADRRYQLEKNAIGVIFYMLLVTFVAYSILYTAWIKKEYVQQVTLLSILNKQMLYNNKRVESFLHKLSKRA